MLVAVVLAFTILSHAGRGGAWKNIMEGSEVDQKNEPMALKASNPPIPLEHSAPEKWPPGGAGEMPTTPVALSGQPSTMAGGAEDAGGPFHQSAPPLISAEGTARQERRRSSTQQTSGGLASHAGVRLPPMANNPASKPDLTKCKLPSIQIASSLQCRQVQM
jgi:hypothetical protein